MGKNTNTTSYRLASSECVRSSSTSPATARVRDRRDLNQLPPKLRASHYYKTPARAGDSQHSSAVSACSSLLLVVK
eukprot:scaffold118388_cov32-Tisochrysis_lutea.AAC.4